MYLTHHEVAGVSVVSTIYDTCESHMYMHIPQLDVLCMAARKYHTLMPQHEPKQGAIQNYVSKPW